MDAGQLNVVKLDVANLADVPGMLRRLATQIEAGDWGEVQSMIALIPREGDYPTVFGWGDVSGINEPIVQLAMAQQWLITNLTERK